MALEIERKFKVLDDRWRKDASVGSELRQAYIMTTKNRTLRVRTIDAKRATLTAKLKIASDERNTNTKYHTWMPSKCSNSRWGWSRKRGTKFATLTISGKSTFTPGQIAALW
ncbi:CYTH domain-containing protein [Sinorhizobium medicae]|uniref:CYTH domain-containing protein n=1 Tax=Sinorhizobium medicae TaxID=110321 RepID=UPI002D219949|nr:CYTH domain-containing protein [Sinorhizobium medicae]